jgi:hypothetical protein
MEYLMTYGWAILIISIVLVGLFSLGVFTVYKTGGNSCTGSVGYLCSNPQLVSNGLLSVTIGQIGKGALTVTGLGCSNTTAMPSAFSSTSFSFQSTQSASVSFSCNLPSSTVGSSFSGTLWIQYTQGVQTGVAQIGTIKAQVTQTGASSGGPVLYAVTYNVRYDDPDFIANGVQIGWSGIGGYVYPPFGPYNYLSGNTISISETSGYFNGWSVSNTANLVLGSTTATPTTLTIYGNGALTVGYWGGSCVAWGTLIMTPNGDEPIQDITNGTIVYSFDRVSGAIVASKVVRTFVVFTDYIYNITTIFGEVTADGNQPFYIGNGTFVSAGNLTAGDSVGIYKNGAIILTKILSINVSYSPQLTYDLDLNNTHTFIAGGYAVHNSPDIIDLAALYGYYYTSSSNCIPANPIISSGITRVCSENFLPYLGAGEPSVTVSRLYANDYPNASLSLDSFAEGPNTTAWQEGDILPGNSTVVYSTVILPDTAESGNLTLYSVYLLENGSSLALGVSVLSNSTAPNRPSLRELAVEVLKEAIAYEASLNQSIRQT